MVVVVVVVVVVGSGSSSSSSSNFVNFSRLCGLALTRGGLLILCLY